MSNRWTWQQAITKSELKPTTRLVLLTIATFMNQHGEGAYPSTTKLAEATGLSERAVCEHIGHARDAGFLTVSQHGFKGQKWARNQYEASWPDSENQAEGTDPNDKKGTDFDAKALTFTQKGTDPNDKKALTEGQSSNGDKLSNRVVQGKKPKNKSTASPIPEGYPDSQALQDGREYLAKYNRMDLEGRLSAQAEAFALHHEAKGSKFKKWHSAWLKWLRQFMEYNPAQSEASGRVSVSEYLKNRGAA